MTARVLTMQRRFTKAEVDAAEARWREVEKPPAPKRDRPPPLSTKDAILARFDELDAIAREIAAAPSRESIAVDDGTTRGDV